MFQIRFSLASLMGGVLIIAFACAAIRFATDLWASITTTLTVATLLVVLLNAVFRRAEARAFSVGFAIFGWGYLALVFGPTTIGPRLLTTDLLTYLELKLQGALDLDANYLYSDVILATSSGRYVLTNNFSMPLWRPFQQIGHSLFALFIALIGALLAQFFHVVNHTQVKAGEHRGQMADPV